MTTNPIHDAFDCGDGVPNLPTPGNETNKPKAPTLDTPRIGAGTAVMAITALGQLLLLLAVLAGGSPAVGLAAGLALFTCGLTLVGVAALRRALNLADPVDPNRDRGAGQTTDLVAKR